MTGTCSRCGSRKGLRRCPALAGPICPRCCGANRLVRIACPTACPHRAAHEAFQREKQGVRYREVLALQNADLREREDDFRLLLAVADLVERAAERIPGLSDGDVARSLDETSCQLSPISLVTQAPSSLTRLLLEELSPLVAEGKVPRDRLREGLGRLAKIAAAMRDPSAPRAFLQGLSHYLDSTLPRRDEGTKRGLILTPDDLRRARG